MAVRTGVFLPTGSLFHERYRIIRGIKSGAMGAVHEARDERTNSPCALKTMLPGVLDDETSRSRFAQEAKITGDIRSDHIVRVTDAGVDDETGMPFLVMELLQGEEIGSLLKKRSHFPIDEALLYLTQVSLALDKAHAASIVHRDLKPGNLFLTARDDGSPCVKILDFGIAKLMSEGQTHATQTVGTPMYMAPEQIIGKSALIGAPTDVLSLAHITYTMLTGEAYWNEEAKKVGVYALIQSVVAGPSEKPTKRALRRRGMTLPDWFDGWFAKATANHPDDRFQRATEAMAEFKEQYDESGPQSFRMVPIAQTRRASASEATATAMPQPPQPPSPPPRRSSEVSSTTRAPVQMDRPSAPTLPPVKKSPLIIAVIAMTFLMFSVTVGIGIRVMFGEPSPTPLTAQRAFTAPLPAVIVVKTAVPAAPAAPAAEEPLEFHADKPPVAPAATNLPVTKPAATSPLPTVKTVPTTPTGKTTKKTTELPPGSID